MDLAIRDKELRWKRIFSPILPVLQPSTIDQLRTTIQKQKNIPVYYFISTFSVFKTTTRGCELFPFFSPIQILKSLVLTWTVYKTVNILCQNFIVKNLSDENYTNKLSDEIWSGHSGRVVRVVAWQSSKTATLLWPRLESSSRKKK